MSTFHDSSYSTYYTDKVIDSNHDVITYSLHKEDRVLLKYISHNPGLSRPIVHSIKENSNKEAAIAWPVKSIYDEDDRFRGYLRNSICFDITLNELIKSKKSASLELNDKYRIILSLCNAIKILHSLNYSFNDLSLNDILLDLGRKSVILDNVFKCHWIQEGDLYDYFKNIPSYTLDEIKQKIRKKEPILYLHIPVYTLEYDSFTLAKFIFTLLSNGKEVYGKSDERSVELLPVFYDKSGNKVKLSSMYTIHKHLSFLDNPSEYIYISQNIQNLLKRALLRENQDISDIPSVDEWIEAITLEIQNSGDTVEDPDSINIPRPSEIIKIDFDDIDHHPKYPKTGTVRGDIEEIIKHHVVIDEFYLIQKYCWTHDIWSMSRSNKERFKKFLRNNFFYKKTSMGVEYALSEKSMEEFNSFVFTDDRECMELEHVTYTEMRNAVLYLFDVKSHYSEKGLITAVSKYYGYQRVTDFVIGVVKCTLTTMIEENILGCYTDGYRLTTGTDIKVQKTGDAAINRLKDYANKGDVDSQYELGLCYYYGDGVKQSYENAVKWFLKAANKHNPGALNSLGYCFENGIGTEESPHQAVECYALSATLNHPLGLFNYGYCYFAGYVVDQSYEKAVELFLKSANLGCVDGQIYLGICYSDGAGVDQSYEKAVSLFKKSAEAGSSYAQYLLGDCYYNGEGVVKSYESAVMWYKKAAEQGEDLAQNKLGTCYLKGYGVPINNKDAFMWFSKAANQDNIESQYMLGNCYYFGNGTLQSYENAVRWYAKSAEQGNKRAQCNLGFCYFKGFGIEQSYENAVIWYTKSAEQGDASAQYNLGTCYEKGFGLEKDQYKAIEWYTRAKDNGNLKAKKKLEELMQ